MENLNTYEAILLPRAFQASTGLFRFWFDGQLIDIDTQTYRFKASCDEEALNKVNLAQLTYFSCLREYGTEILYNYKQRKLHLSEYEFLKNEVIKTMHDYPELRLGQTWFNELVAHLPQFEWIRATDLDPFHRDEVLLDLFFHILDEQAYASWTHSDNYKRLHKEWTDNHPPTPVDTSGSELSDFVDAPLALEFPVETVSYTIPDDWQKALEDSVKEEAERYIREAEEVKQKELKLMENAQVNIVHENEHTPMIANNSTSDTTIVLKPGASIGTALSYAQDYCPKTITWTEPDNKKVNVTLRLSTKKDLDKVLLLIRDLLSTNPATELTLEGLEIAQW